MKKQICVGYFMIFFISISIAQTLNTPAVDNSSYEGKVMFGYQGWFGHPYDESVRPNFWHWGNLSVVSMDALNVDMYPDLREYCSDEKYPTAYSFADSSVAPVFSSGNRQSVMRHIKWVRDYNVDGVFLQRFISEYEDQVVMQFRDDVTASVMEASELYGRVFSIMYDGVANSVDEIKADWMHMVDDLNILESPSYLNHEGRPLVALWGFTVYPLATVGQLEELIDWFHNTAPVKYRASIKLGLNDNWFNKSNRWLNAFSDVEVISPWSVGRYTNETSYKNYLTNQLIPGKTFCDNKNILYVPVIWPGFSWHNLKDGTSPKNQIPRDGGNFYWMQSYGAINAGVKTIYIAMLDEMDESTAMFKISENAAQSPNQGYWLNLDADGYSLPSDWYLRCAGKTTKILRGNVTNSSSLGVPNEGIMAIQPNDDSCQMTFLFPDFTNETELDISIDGGITYPYTTSDTVGNFAIDNLSAANYNVFVKHPGSNPVPMGEVRIFGNCGTLNTGNIQFVDAVVYPNPSNNSFNVQVNDIVEIKVYNVLGKLVLTTNRNEIELNNEPAGVYIFEIITRNNKIIKKVIKK